MLVCRGRYCSVVWISWPQANMQVKTAPGMPWRPCRERYCCVQVRRNGLAHSQEQLPSFRPTVPNLLTVDADIYICYLFVCSSLSLSLFFPFHTFSIFFFTLSFPPFLSPSFRWLGSMGRGNGCLLYREYCLCSVWFCPSQTGSRAPSDGRHCWERLVWKPVCLYKALCLK